VVSRTTCRRFGWHQNDPTACWTLAVVWPKEDRSNPSSDLPTAPTRWETGRRGSGRAIYVIGIDPTRGSHTAAVLDTAEELVGELRVVADEDQHK
jgi:hypothetical protein